MGVSTEKLKVFKESWWWKDEVQNNIKDKNKRFKEHMTCTEEEERYKRERATKKQNGQQRQKVVLIRTFIRSLIPKRGRNVFLSWQGIGPGRSKT